MVTKPLQFLQKICFLTSFFQITPFKRILTKKSPRVAVKPSNGYRLNLYSSRYGAQVGRKCVVSIFGLALSVEKLGFLRPTNSGVSIRGLFICVYES